MNEIIRILRSSEILVYIDKLARENEEISHAEVINALKNLSDVWGYLYQAEQRKIVKKLVNSVQIQNSGLKLNLNLDGINRLLIDLS